MNDKVDEAVAKLTEDLKRQGVLSSPYRTSDVITLRTLLTSHAEQKKVLEWLEKSWGIYSISRNLNTKNWMIWSYGYTFITEGPTLTDVVLEAIKKESQ